jgi:hypothetical protein
MEQKGFSVVCLPGASVLYSGNDKLIFCIKIDKQKINFSLVIWTRNIVMAVLNKFIFCFHFADFKWVIFKNQYLWTGSTKRIGLVKFRKSVLDYRISNFIRF